MRSYFDFRVGLGQKIATKGTSDQTLCAFGGEFSISAALLLDYERLAIQENADFLHVRTPPLIQDVIASLPKLEINTWCQQFPEYRNEHGPQSQITLRIERQGSQSAKELVASVDSTSIAGLTRSAAATNPYPAYNGSNWQKKFIHLLTKPKSELEDPGARLLNRTTRR